MEEKLFPWFNAKNARRKWFTFRGFWGRWIQIQCWNFQIQNGRANMTRKNVKNWFYLSFRIFSSCATFHSSQDLLSKWVCVTLHLFLQGTKLRLVFLSCLSHFRFSHHERYPVGSSVLEYFGKARRFTRPISLWCPQQHGVPSGGGPPSPRTVPFQVWEHG